MALKPNSQGHSGRSMGLKHEDIQQNTGWRTAQNRPTKGGVTSLLKWSGTEEGKQWDQGISAVAQPTRVGSSVEHVVREGTREERQSMD